MLVPMIPVCRVQVPVVDIVDVVAVPYRRMTALRAVRVAVLTGRLVRFIRYDHLGVLLVRHHSQCAAPPSYENTQHGRQPEPT